MSVRAFAPIPRLPPPGGRSARARRELVLRHGERRQRRVRVLERPRRDPRIDRRLELRAKALEVEVGELRLLLGVRVDPRRERRDVDLRLRVRARAAAFVDSMRAAFARAPAFACSPFQRLAW
jgi:hypothetical protein